MAQLETKHFGKIDLKKPNEWYETEIELNGKVIEVLITYSKTALNVDQEILQNIDNFIDNLNTNETKIRHVIHDDFKQKGNTAYYIENQIEEQDKNDISRLIRNADKKLTKKEKLLSVLTLLRIVFYPEKEDNVFAVFDYTIDEEITDDLLAVKFYKDNSISIDIES